MRDGKTMDIGEKLKQVRLIQGKSQREMIDDYFDRSFYSRVENGKNGIAAEDLINILQKNNASIINFVSDFGDVQPKNKRYQEKIEQAFAAKDINKLRAIQEDDDFTNKIAKDVIELMIVELENKIDKHKKLISCLKNYIYKLDKWDGDSLWVLSYTMFIYQFNDLEGIMGSIFSKYQNSKIIDNEIIRLLARISVNYLQICLRRDKAKTQINKTLYFLNKLPDISEITLYKLYGVFCQAKYEKDEKTCNYILEILKECGYANCIK